MLEAAVLVIGLTAAYVWRADFGHYSILTTGVFRRVSRSVVESDHECGEELCEATVSPGERRRWYKEIVVAGMPVVRYGGGERYYCEDHVSFELHGELDEVPPSTTERLAVTLAGGIVSVLDTMPERERKQEEHPFDNMATGVGATALDLLPVVLLVLIAAVVINGVRMVSPE